MKFLVLPIVESVEKDYRAILEALSEKGRLDLTKEYRQKGQWIEVDSAHPCVEIKIK